jgi:hypothetical protein
MTNTDAVINDLQETISSLRDELTLWKGRAKRLAWIAIGNAETEAEIGLVAGTTFESMIDIYDMFSGDNEIQRDVLIARKTMRQSEWGCDFRATEFDLELDPEWQE